MHHTTATVSYQTHCCQIPSGLLGLFSQKIRPLEKKIRLQAGHPPNHQKKWSKKILLQIFGPIIVKIRPQLGNLELGRFLGRWLPRPQEILLGRFWVQRPWIRPSGTSDQTYLSRCQYFGRKRISHPFEIDVFSLKPAWFCADGFTVFSFLVDEKIKHNVWACYFEITH